MSGTANEQKESEEPEESEEWKNSRSRQIIREGLISGEITADLADTSSGIRDCPCCWASAEIASDNTPRSPGVRHPPLPAAKAKESHTSGHARWTKFARRIISVFLFVSFHQVRTKMKNQKTFFEDMLEDDNFSPNPNKSDKSFFENLHFYIYLLS